MKLLMIFCDAFMGMRLKNCNQNLAEKSIMDKYFEKLGGTLYRNTYSETPETHRATASFLTGMRPLKNGVVSYLQGSNNEIDSLDQDNIFGFLHEQKFRILTYNNKDEDEEGSIVQALPKNPEKVIEFFDSLEECLKTFNKIDENENVAIYLYDPNYHHAVNKYNNFQFEKGTVNKIGQQSLKDLLDQIFSMCPYSDFDDMYIFSDHGITLHDEEDDMTRIIKNKINVTMTLNDDRTKNLMFRRKKGDEKLIVSERLSLIMDIYPTIRQEILNKTEDCYDGISLMNSDGHDYLIFEDFDLYHLIRPGDSPKVWAYRTLEKYYIENIETCVYMEIKNGEYFEKIVNSETQTEIQDVFKKITTSYDLVQRQKKFYLDQYKEQNALRRDWVQYYLETDQKRKLIKEILRRIKLAILFKFRKR